MPTKRQKKKNLDRLRNPPSVSVPGIGTRINLPDRPALAWYAGLGLMAAVELIDWPVALAIGGMHFIESHVHNRNIQELVEGVEAGV